MPRNDRSREVRENATRHSPRIFGMRQGLTGSTSAESSGRSSREQRIIETAGQVMSGIVPDTSKGTKSVLKKPRVEDKPRESSGYNTRSKRRKARFSEKTDEIDTY